MKEKHPLLVDILDICRKNTSLHICTSSGQQDVVRMPIDGKNGRPDGFLEELRDPPVTLFVKGADRDGSNDRLTAIRTAPTDNAAKRT